jgi:hypothetical protein
MESKKSLPISIRPAAEADIPFIFSSWLKSYRSSRFAQGITNTVFFGEHHKVLEQLFKTANVLIICDQKNSTDIYGYICAEIIDNIFVVHYMYIKHTYRLFGLAKIMMEQFNHSKDSTGICTHLTRVGEKVAAKYNLVYSPYLAYTAEYRNKAKKQLDERNQKQEEELLEQTREE